MAAMDQVRRFIGAAQSPLELLFSPTSDLLSMRVLLTVVLARLGPDITPDDVADAEHALELVGYEIDRRIPPRG